VIRSVNKAHRQTGRNQREKNIACIRYEETEKMKKGYDKPRSNTLAKQGL
jgi:hypothetical protein